MAEDITGQQTRLRLLDAGLAVFSEVGYHGATIREIAGRAGTNIAAISYHFGGEGRPLRRGRALGLRGGGR